MPGGVNYTGGSRNNHIHRKSFVTPLSPSTPPPLISLAHRNSSSRRQSEYLAQNSLQALQAARMVVDGVKESRRGRGIETGRKLTREKPRFDLAFARKDEEERMKEKRGVEALEEGEVIEKVVEKRMRISEGERYDGLERYATSSRVSQTSSHNTTRLALLSAPDWACTAPPKRKTKTVFVSRLPKSAMKPTVEPDSLSRVESKSTRLRSEISDKIDTPSGGEIIDEDGSEIFFLVSGSVHDVGGMEKSSDYDEILEFDEDKHDTIPPCHTILPKSKPTPQAPALVLLPPTPTPPPPSPPPVAFSITSTPSTKPPPRSSSPDPDTPFSVRFPISPSFYLPRRVDWTGPCSETFGQRQNLKRMFIFERYEAEDRMRREGVAPEERLGQGVKGEMDVAVAVGLEAAKTGFESEAGQKEQVGTSKAPELFGEGDFEGVED